MSLNSELQYELMSYFAGPVFNSIFFEFSVLMCLIRQVVLTYKLTIFTLDL